MVEAKWQSSKVDPNREYIAFTETGERNSLWSFLSILMKAQKVGQELKKANGALAFTARLGLFSRDIGMVAVFEDEKTLMEFAHAGQHSQCMERFKAVTKFKRAKWSISGSALPLKWDDAINKVQSQK